MLFMVILKKLHEIAEAMMISPGTVSNVKRRYLKGGLEHWLRDRSRPGAKLKIEGWHLLKQE